MNSKPITQAALLVLLAAAATGCKTLVPYESTFMCEKAKDIGKCLDMQAAYEAALASEDKDSQRGKGRDWRAGGAADRSSSRPLRRLPKAQGVQASTSSQPNLNPAIANVDLYRELQYRELANLIEQPVTPLVRPPTVLRTLIVSYTAADSLYMPRFVFYFADEARFVIGDYLNPADTRPMVYPAGQRKAAQ